MNDVGGKAVARKRVAELRREIAEHDRAYYVLQQPTVSDATYDALMRELRDLEARYPDLVTPDSPAQRVSGTPGQGFRPHTHRVPMLSLDNAFSLEALREFDARIKRRLRLAAKTRVGYVVELKIDGVAVSLTYRGRRLAVGATRGDGVTGEDVTANLRTLRDVPEMLAKGAPRGEVEIRGEVFLSHTEFARINQSFQGHQFLDSGCRLLPQRATLQRITRATKNLAEKSLMFCNLRV
jgi:DNA ligase (NAD+)